MAIGLATELTPAEASAAFRPGGGGGHFHSAGPFPGALSGGGLHGFAGQTRSADFAFAGGDRHAFAFDRGRRDFDFRHRHRRFFFVGGPFLGFDYGYGYGYDCNPYWNGYRWVYPYGYGYACGYGG
jgi:hypothetical protein